MSKTYKHVCIGCGKDFEDSIPTTKYCIDCILQNPRLHPKRYARNKTYFCLYCGKELERGIKGQHKYCKEHRSNQKRLCKKTNICVWCGKEFHPTEARPDAKTCCRYCQGKYINAQGLSIRYNDAELKARFINYFKEKGIPVSSEQVFKDLHLTHNVLLTRGWKLTELAKEAGITEPFVPKNTSKFENMVYSCLKTILPETEIIRQKRFKECRDKQMLPFDFYIEKYNLIIEADGAQHFKDNTKYAHFDKPMLHDQIKNKFCKKQKIYLLRVRYQRFINQEILKDVIKNLLLQIERSEANYLNCWDGMETFPISSQGLALKTKQGSTTSQK